jgi:hypothetical protein
MFDKTYWQAAEKFVADDAPRTRMCETPGCAEAGMHRAPMSPRDVHNYRWFCLPHVQEYNKAWDFYKGMDVTQMERVRREDVVGWRPTWPLGYLRPGQTPTAEEMKRHVFEKFFGRNGRNDNARVRQQETTIKTGLTAEEQQALVRLQLQWPVSVYELKQRYRMLVKKHHPDAVASAGIDETAASRAEAQRAKAAAEELIKLINRAYAVLKKKVRG